MKEREIRILLVDDHDLVLQGLKRIVECSLPEIKNVCTASSGQEALLLIASQRFNLFVLDMELPDISGMDIIVRIREKDPQARIIVNTMHEEIWFIKNLIQCSVDGILFKSIDSTKIAEAIRRVLDGETYYCPYAEHVRAQMKRSDEGRREELTLRELDVLKRISEGKNTQEIAQELCVSTNTVDTHRRHLMDKLDARNVADLIMTAISKGIIPIRKC
ncbi:MULTISPECIES: response regulator [Bacteroides]|uniref:DNA-binding response regulator n=2 Tax=Bacteroides clarus TaxID=626929 RepID=A0A1Y4JRH8_9BACE|nr:MULTISPECIES: response regulator transcription factor [Bacteroides]EGF54426.1 response regulator receiver domain protein [Bacteroides clarus YIT 12056]OUO01796.1 DNA-binding response regulator [Bacteroides clarus]OUP33359.1 DNA-binding response regulator [Bacteroides clarus]RGT31037.1 DNA-binding response regulator [Bacteroides clarus]HJF98147.1 response regulator transcription factor [Bacteroides clarus]